MATDINFSLFFPLLPDLKAMSSDFVFGFIQCLDGEKDPRNLMLAFTLIKSIIQEFDIAQHVEVSQQAQMTIINKTAIHR